MTEANRNTKQMVHRFIENMAPPEDTIFGMKVPNEAQHIITNTICDYYIMSTRSSLMHWLAKQWDDGDIYHRDLYMDFSSYAARHLMFEAIDDTIPIINDYDTIFTEFFSSYPRSEFDYFKSVVQDLSIKINIKINIISSPNQPTAESQINDLHATLHYQRHHRCLTVHQWLHLNH
eukprot:509727_1